MCYLWNYLKKNNESTYLNRSTDIATIVYANSVPIDIISINCSKSKRTAMIPKT